MLPVFFHITIYIADKQNHNVSFFHYCSALKGDSRTSHTYRTDPNWLPKMLSYYRGLFVNGRVKSFPWQYMQQEPIASTSKAEPLKSAAAREGEKYRKWENTLSPLLMAKPFTKHYFHGCFQCRKRPAHQPKHKACADFTSRWQDTLSLPHTFVGEFNSGHHDTIQIYNKNMSYKNSSKRLEIICGKVRPETYFTPVVTNLFKPKIPDLGLDERQDL